MRFRLLETTRDYGRRQLVTSNTAGAIRDRHLVHYLALAEKAAPELTGPHQGEWLDRLETEHGNLLVALAWALSDSGQLSAVSGQKGKEPVTILTDTGHRSLAAEQGIRLAVALGRFWYVHGWFSEGRESLARAIQKNPSRTSNELGHALRWAGGLAWSQGDYDEARRLLNEGLAIFRATADKKGVAAALNSLGLVARDQADYAEARRLHQESLAICRELGDKHGISHSLTNLGIVAGEQGDYEEAERLFQESFTIDRELHDKSGIASSLNNLGLVAGEQGEYEEAKRLHQESLAIKRQLGDKWGIAASLDSLGEVAHEQGDYDEANRLHQESLVIFRELGHKHGIAYALENLGKVAASERKAGRASRLFGAADALLEAIHAPLAPVERARHEKHVAAAKAALGEDAYNRAYAEGRAMPLDAAIVLALQPD